MALLHVGNVVSSVTMTRLLFSARAGLFSWPNSPVYAIYLFALSSGALLLANVITYCHVSRRQRRLLGGVSDIR